LSGLSLRLSLPAVTIAVPLTVEAAVLTNGEIRGLAFRHLALGPRQGGPNQRPMHRPLIGVVNGVGLGRL
jgi:hypothetical protein